MTSGRPAFQQHEEHAEGSDTSHVSHTRKAPERRAYKPQFRQKRKRSRSPAGPRRLGTATRISASLSRRLSAFFGSTHGQAPKAAKFAVLPPGHAGFPNRVKRSEGSDTTPIRNAPCFAVWAVVCDLSPKDECVPDFTCESERGPFVREVGKRDESDLEQRCGGNFLAIFAGTILSEKLNLTGGIFEWRRPFDFSTR